MIGGFVDLSHGVGTPGVKTKGLRHAADHRTTLCVVTHELLVVCWCSVGSFVALFSSTQSRRG